MGGDEFAVLQREPADAAETQARVDCLIALLSVPFEIDDRSVFISASIGITLFPDDADHTELLHRNADLAMYCAKTQGRNRCQFFDKSLDDELHRRSSLEQALRELDAGSQFHIAYQPQVDMRSGCVTGVEALLRWNHPNGRLVGPDEFVPILEHSGMIVEVGAWVLRESCRQAMRWRQDGLPPLTLAVNVAAAQFHAGDMPRLVAAVLAETGLTPSWLELEITETGIMHDMRVAADALIALHELGVGLAIDDFGTGYSSLSYLRSCRSIASRSIGASSWTSRRARMPRLSRPPLCALPTICASRWWPKAWRQRRSRSSSARSDAASRRASSTAGRRTRPTSRGCWDDRRCWSAHDERNE